MTTTDVNDMEFMGDEEDEESKAYIAHLQKAMNAQASKERQKELRQGGMRIFSMPKPDANGRCKATIRFLAPLSRCKTFLEHFKFQSFHLVCPIDVGFDTCEWCNRICAVNNITREQLVDDVSSYDNKMWSDVLDKTTGEPIIDPKTNKKKREKQFDTREVNAWPIWYYEANEGAGELQIFGYPINGNSPIPGIHTLYTERCVEPPPDQRLNIMEFDIQLTQHGEGRKRTFTPLDTVRGPFQYADRIKGIDISKEAMLWGYALGLPFNQDEAWLSKLQEKRKHILAAQPKTVKVKNAPKDMQRDEKPLSVADSLQLSLSEEEMSEV